MPDITEYAHEAVVRHSSFVVLATDGVTQFLTNEKIAEVVAREAPDVKRSTERLADIAVKRWKMVRDQCVMSPDRVWRRAGCVSWKYPT